MTKNGNNTLTWRVTQLERGSGETSEKLDEIMENHLPHLSEKISKLETRVNVSTALNIGAIIVGALILKYL